MRLSETKRHEIKRKILGDLYDKAENDVHQRQADICKKSYADYIVEYLPIIKKLPAEFFRRDYSITTSFTLPEDGTLKTFTLTDTSMNEKDYFYLQKKIGGRSWEGNSVVQLRDKYLKGMEKLIKEKEVISEEKAKMEKYLLESINEWTTTSKLKKNWPVSLHKYIPPEPARAPRKKKEVKPDVQIDTPSELNVRLTTNLLEA